MGLASPWQGRESSRQGQAEKWCFLTMLCFWLTEEYRCSYAELTILQHLLNIFMKYMSEKKWDTKNLCKIWETFVSVSVVCFKINPWCLCLRETLLVFMVMKRISKGEWAKRLENRKLYFFQMEKMYLKNEIPAVLDLILDLCNLWI